MAELNRVVGGLTGMVRLYYLNSIVGSVNAQNGVYFFYFLVSVQYMGLKIRPCLSNKKSLWD